MNNSYRSPTDYGTNRRKDKLGLFTIAQNPDEINGDIVKQVNTNVFLQLREKAGEYVPPINRRNLLFVDTRMTVGESSSRRWVRRWRL